MHCKLGCLCEIIIIRSMIPHLHGKFNTVYAANPPNLAVFPWLFYWLPCKNIWKKFRCGKPTTEFLQIVSGYVNRSERRRGIRLPYLLHSRRRSHRTFRSTDARRQSRCSVCSCCRHHYKIVKCNPARLYTAPVQQRWQLAEYFADPACLLWHRIKRIVFYSPQPLLIL